MNNMQLMHYNMHQKFNQGQRRGLGQGRGPARERGRSGGRVQDQGAQRGGGMYCHTHGNCAHVGADYCTPNATHVNEDTFANMMGGSTARYYWINP